MVLFLILLNESSLSLFFFLCVFLISINNGYLLGYACLYSVSNATACEIQESNGFK